MGSKRAVLAHVGIMGDRPGGIAQVVNQYLAWSYDDVRVIGIQSTRGRRDWLSPILWLVAAARIVTLRVTAGRSVVLVHLSAKGSFVREGSLVMLARALGHSPGIHLHGSQFPDFSSRYPRLVLRVCSSSRSIFVLTDESASILQTLLRNKPVRIVRLQNVVEVPETQQVKGNIVLFGGEVGTRKGADTLLAAWEHAQHEAPSWELILAGPVTPEISRVAIESRGVRALGPVPHAELLRLAATSAIAVLPSRNEAMPMFLLESMARGCAVVATPVGQVRELVEGAGELVEVGDVDALAGALVALTSDHERVQQLGALARQRVLDRYSPKQVRSLLESEWRLLSDGDLDHV